MPDGFLSNNVYTNDAFGVKYEIPGGWNATPDPKGEVELDYAHPNGIANQCTKILLSLKAPQKVEGRFASFASIVAIDPRCIADADFPQSVQDKEKIDRATDKIIKVFKNTPYLSPYGVKIIALPVHGQMLLWFTGALTINAIEGHPAPKKEPLVVHTTIMVSESKGYWIAMAYVLDDSGEEAVKARMAASGIEPPPSSE